MNLKHAQYVMAVVREGSITAAAKKLYISQPSLSQTIKLVEQETGLALFERGTTPLRLTYAGSRYIDAAKKMMQIDANLQNEFSALRMETHGRMRLGFSVQRGMMLLPRVLPVFMQKYPHVKVELIEQGSVMLEKLVAEGECDVALVTTTPHSKDELEYTLIMNERIVLIAANDTEIASRLEDGTEIELREAARERFVELSPGHSVRVVQDNLFALHSMSPEILLETNVMETGKRITANCRAVMLCPDVYVIGDAELAGKVKLFPLRYSDEFARHSYVCWRKEVHQPQFVHGFLEILQQHIRDTEQLTPASE